MSEALSVFKILRLKALRLITLQYFIYALSPICDVHLHSCFLGSSDGKESACNAGDPGSIPGLGRSPGEGNGNPLQYSCLENTMDKGAL